MVVAVDLVPGHEAGPVVPSVAWGGMPVPSSRPFPDRASSWARRHVFAVDALWALLWFVLSMSLWPFSSETPVDALLYIALSLACCAALSVRRIRPWTALTALAVLLLIQVLWSGMFTVLSVVCVLVCAYTSRTELGPAGRRVVLALLLAGTAWAFLFVPGLSPVEDLGARLTSVVAGWSTTLLFALLGTVRRRRREEVDRLVEHARLLEEGRERELRLAALDERTRIAREMHDVLAHSLSVVVAQADGGRYAARTSPERAVTALETIGRVGRESSRELHRLLGVLRVEDDPAPSPVPGLDDLPSLIDDHRSSGLDVRLVDVPPPGEVVAPPASVSLTVYRIVQESLANALKHAGAVSARVDLDRSSGRIVVTVTNRPGPEGRKGEDGASGHGLIGMRERVALHGGSLKVGEDPATGLWRVRAIVPWEDA